VRLCERNRYDAPASKYFRYGMVGDCSRGLRSGHPSPAEFFIGCLFFGENLCPDVLFGDGAAAVGANGAEKIAD